MVNFTTRASGTAYSPNKTYRFNLQTWEFDVLVDGTYVLYRKAFPPTTFSLGFSTIVQRCAWRGVSAMHPNFRKFCKQLRKNLSSTGRIASSCGKYAVDLDTPSVTGIGEHFREVTLALAGIYPEGMDAELREFCNYLRTL